MPEKHRYFRKSSFSEILGDSIFTEYAECAFIKGNTPCNFIFQHNRKQLHFVMCDAKNRKVCLVAKIYSKHHAPPERVVLFYIPIARR